MTPAAILNILSAGGFGCRLDGERLIVHQASQLTPQLRALVVESKSDLVAFLKAQSQAANEDDIPRRLWLITHEDGRWISHSFTPPAAEAEIRAWYPQALHIEPDEEFNHE